jgi:hypothetical protein
VEKSVFLFLFRLLSRRVLGLGLWFFCGFHLKNKLRSHIVVQLNWDLVFTGIFDRTLKNNLVSVNLRAELVLDAIHNILRGNGPKGLAGLAGLQRKDEPRLPDSARQFFCLVQLAGFALGAFLFECVELAQSARCDLVCLSARQEIIARIAAAHFDYVRLSTQTGNVFRQDKFSQRHIDFSKAR